MPVDVRAIGCDWLTGTARKFLRGPRGVGFLFASRRAHVYGLHFRSRFRLRVMCTYRCPSVRGALCEQGLYYFWGSLCAHARY